MIKPVPISEVQLQLQVGTMASGRMQVVQNSKSLPIVSTGEQRRRSLHWHSPHQTVRSTGQAQGPSRGSHQEQKQTGLLTTCC